MQSFLTTVSATFGQRLFSRLCCVGTSILPLLFNVISSISSIRCSPERLATQARVFVAPSRLRPFKGLRLSSCSLWIQMQRSNKRLRQLPPPLPAPSPNSPPIGRANVALKFRGRRAMPVESPLRCKVKEVISRPVKRASGRCSLNRRDRALKCSHHLEQQQETLRSSHRSILCPAWIGRCQLRGLFQRNLRSPSASTRARTLSQRPVDKVRRQLLHSKYARHDRCTMLAASRQAHLSRDHQRCISQRHLR
jgi:hypothetical protein